MSDLTAGFLLGMFVMMITRDALPPLVKWIRG